MCYTHRCDEAASQRKNAKMTIENAKTILTGEQYIAMKTDALGRRPQSKFMKQVYRAMTTGDDVAVIIYPDRSRELLIMD
tara:strand:+ start:1386 stop:1625 length:240 start_codon:yes stop_codon:yes gene_type:complete